MILVTGATGFLGSRLLQQLNAANETVRAIARDLPRVPKNLALPNVEWVQGDVLDVVSLEEAMQGVERVYHCAALVSFDARHHQSMMNVNVTGTANVVNAALAANVKKLLHVSSIAALGRSNRDQLIDENSEWTNGKDNSVYAQSKYLAEREVWRGTQEGLPAVIVNPSVIIGSGNWTQGTPRLFRSARNGMPFYPRGVNGFVSVDDVVNCMIQLMNNDFANERYVVSSENVSYKDFLTLTTKALDVKSPTIPLSRFVTNLSWLASSLLHKTFGVAPLLTRETARTVNGTYRYSNEKIKKAIGYDFKPAKEFITETALAYKNQKN